MTEHRVIHCGDGVPHVVPHGAQQQVRLDPPHDDTTLPLFCMSVSHHSAPVDLLERVGFSEAARDETLHAARHDPRVGRMIVVSTCNRVELYAHIDHASADDARAVLLEYLTRGSRETNAAVEPHVHFLHGEPALRHLARVSAGLESLVLGESQIITQLTTALRAAIAAHAASPLLKRTFKWAINTGEQARRTVWHAAGATSLSAVAADILSATRQDASLADMHAIVVGAGTMGRLAVKALQARGVSRITVANRTLARAQDVAHRYGVAAVALETLANAALDADALLVATNAPGVLLTRETVETVMTARRTRPLTIVDIGMPRNVDPHAGGIEGVTLTDLDAIRAHIERAQADRAHLAPHAEALTEEALRAHGATRHAVAPSSPASTTRTAPTARVVGLSS